MNRVIPISAAVMALLAGAVVAQQPEVIDVRTFEATSAIRLEACKAATDEANEWSRTSTNLVFDATTTRIGECACEEVKARLSTNEVVAEVERSFGIGDSNYYCLVKLEVMAKED